MTNDNGADKKDVLTKYHELMNELGFDNLRLMINPTVSSSVDEIIGDVCSILELEKDKSGLSPRITYNA